MFRLQLQLSPKIVSTQQQKQQKLLRNYFHFRYFFFSNKNSILTNRFFRCLFEIKFIIPFPDVTFFCIKLARVPVT